MVGHERRHCPRRKLGPLVNRGFSRFGSLMGWVPSPSTTGKTQNSADFWGIKTDLCERPSGLFLLGRTFLHLEWCLSHHLWGFMINASVVSWIYEWIISTGAGGIDADTWRISWKATFTNNGNLPRKFGFQAGQDKGGIVDVHSAVSKRGEITIKTSKTGCFLAEISYNLILTFIVYLTNDTKQKIII